MLGEKISHSLLPPDTANKRASKPPALKNKLCRRKRRGLGQPEEHHGPVMFEQVQIGVVVVLRGHRVDDEVEAVRILLEDALVFRGDKVVSTESQSIFSLIRGMAEHC